MRGDRVPRTIPLQFELEIRYWVIFNNQFRPVPQITAPNWPTVKSSATDGS
jgi:hypothetical protein